MEGSRGTWHTSKAHVQHYKVLYSGVRNRSQRITATLCSCRLNGERCVIGRGENWCSGAVELRIMVPTSVFSVCYMGLCLWNT